MDEVINRGVIYIDVEPGRNNSEKLILLRVNVTRVSFIIIFYF